MKFYIKSAGLLFVLSALYGCGDSGSSAESRLNAIFSSSLSALPSETDPTLLDMKRLNAMKDGEFKLSKIRFLTDGKVKSTGSISLAQMGNPDPSKDTISAKITEWESSYDESSFWMAIPAHVSLKSGDLQFVSIRDLTVNLKKNATAAYEVENASTYLKERFLELATKVINSIKGDQKLFSDDQYGFKAAVRADDSWVQLISETSGDGIFIKGIWEFTYLRAE